MADTEAGSPLRKACPEFDRQIQRLLTRAWHRVNEPGEVRVRFVLRGSRIVEVQEGQGTYRYLRYVRQAIGELECDGGSGEDRTFDLIVTFVEVWPD